MASVWEIAIKVAVGKLNLPVGVRAFVSDGCRQLGAELIGVDLAHLDALAGLPPLHRDPFDRMLVAQAMADRLRLLSYDAAMSGYDVELVPGREPR